MGGERRESAGMKTDISPMWLTYHMLDWGRLEQYDTHQACALCGRFMKKTEPVTDGRGEYEGYVCHADRQVTWVKLG